MRTVIVNYNKLDQTSFDVQINKALEDIEQDNNTVKDIKVMNEKRVMIVYSQDKFI